MNTDKLMELLDEVIALQSQHYGNGAMTHMELSEWARKAKPRLAALRAEQAVGDEQRARELAEIATWHRRMHLELSGKGSEWAAKEMYACRHGKFAETIERALGTARQSEGVVVVPRNLTKEMRAAATKIEWGGDEVDECWAAMLAAAPGGEGEG